MQGHGTCVRTCVRQEVWICKGACPQVLEVTRGEALFLERGGKERWQEPLPLQPSARDSRKKPGGFVALL